MRKNAKSGAALVVVLCLAAPAMLAIAMMSSLGNSYMLRSRGTAHMEKAFFVAEGGAEHAVQYIAEGGAVPVTLSGTLGEGEYQVVIQVEAPAGGGMSVNGTLRINPNNSPQASFFMELPDGSFITRQDLHQGHAGYDGQVMRIHFRPMGGGSQSGLIVDGSAYSVQNNNVYSIISSNMTARLFNNHPNQAIAHWQLEINAMDATFTDSGTPAVPSRYTRYHIFSEGTVGNVSRRVHLEGLHAVSWARYALWYDDEALQLWMVGGEVFEGPVHSNVEMRFHSHNVSSLGQTRFMDRVTSSHASYRTLNSSVQPVFERGISLGAPSQTTTAINFDELADEASLILNGITSIALSGTNMVISNARQGWNNHTMPIPEEGMVYVRSATTGAQASRPGDVHLSAPDGLQGRLSIVAERDINIDDHVRYALNPISNPESNDALGLISRRHVVVQTDAPNDLDIFAHIIAVEGGFGVEDYNSSTLGDRGILHVYGGIVNKTRHAVGSTGGTGYGKNYVYDSRFQTDPPPSYPVVPNAYQWAGWSDH